MVEILAFSIFFYLKGSKRFSLDITQYFPKITYVTFGENKYTDFVIQRFPGKFLVISQLLLFSQ